MTVPQDNWAAALLACRQRGEAHALATVIATSGSTPRDSGCKMLITAAHTIATIGGGGLEHLVVTHARELLQQGGDRQELKQFALGAEARQCCGGSMTVLLECFAAVPAQLVIFGAGHVCNALLAITGRLALRTTVVDARAELLAALPTGDNIITVHATDPLAVRATLADGSLILVMTHEHGLDYALVRALLEDWRWGLLGMIGSATKAHRFRMRLRNDGFSEAELAQLQCPIGLPGLKGKLPMEVAVSVSAALLQQLQQLQAGARVASGSQDWRELNRQVRAVQAARGRES